MRCLIVAATILLAVTVAGRIKKNKNRSLRIVDGTTRVQTPGELQRYDPKLYELLGRVYLDHHIPMDVYYGKNIPPRRRQ